VSDWQEIVAVDGMDVHYSPGESTSLATVDGYPAISFTSYEAGNHNLMYAILLWDEP